MQKNISSKIFLALLLAVLLILPAAVDLGYLLQSAIVILLYMYWACCWNIMGGYAGLFSLGNGIYIGLGAYTSAILWVNLGLTPWLGMLAGGLVAGLISLAMGYPTFKLKGMYYSLATFALLSVFRIIFTSNKYLFGIQIYGSDGYKIPVDVGFWNMQFNSKLGYYYIVIALVVISIAVCKFISKSQMGYYFRAIKANQGSAASLGVNVVKLKLQAQFITAFLTGVGGAFYAQLMQYLGPSTIFGTDLSITILILVIVGGSGTLWGPVVGAAILMPLNQYFRTALSNVSGLATIIYGLTLALVVFFAPGGILGVASSCINKRRAAKAVLAAAASDTEGGDSK